MSARAADLAEGLARRAEAVCRHYLPKGHRQGRYWCVGDVHGTPGRSLFVRLAGPEPGPGAAGRWQDAATGEYGDLLDLIALNRGLASFRDLAAEARHFLILPLGTAPRRPRDIAPRYDAHAAACPSSGHGPRPICAPAASRGRSTLPPCASHPALWYRAAPDAERQSWPGLLAAVTDFHGRITGVHRTFLTPAGPGCPPPAKAPLPDPRRALGALLGNGVRFGRATDVLLAGEGIETVLSLKSLLPDLPMIAALSAGHLAAITFPPGLKHLYVAQDNDAAGRMAAERLQARGESAGIEVCELVPVWGDFNEDLMRMGPRGLRRRLGREIG
ncbi:toprim domain-containing protein [Xanthobacter sp. AM11]|uniref:toprim domain-containing protein n=1 Tax=Xanthobacter sp. AM11 TaxID=3380643 RepID=UPI0039BEDD7F